MGKMLVGMNDARLAIISRCGDILRFGMFVVIIEDFNGW